MSRFADIAARSIAAHGLSSRDRRVAAVLAHAAADSSIGSARARSNAAAGCQNRIAGCYGFGKPRLAAIALMVSALLFTGCISHTRAYVTDVSAQEWRTPAIITIPNTDTTGLCDIDIFIRSNDNFTTDTLTLLVTFFTPDSIRCEERLFVTRQPNRRSPSMAQETRIPYRTHVRLQREGEYRVHLTPDFPVAGIEAAGIQIEKRY